MTTIFARHARLPDGWADDVVVEVGRSGAIASVTRGAADTGGPARILAPAAANLHSHAFQRAMAGMSEHRGSGRGSSWTWRALRYRFLDYLTAEDVEAIAGPAFWPIWSRSTPITSLLQGCALTSISTAGSSRRAATRCASYGQQVGRP